jgi:CRP/FNR family transcriptional regulator, cyclic AMP receptor protein
VSDEKLAALRKVPLLRDCDPSAMAAIEQLVDEVELRDGMVLIRQGDLGQEFFMILAGKVRVERDGVLLRYLGPGDFLGEIALIHEGRRTATVTAEGPVRAAVLTHQAFHGLLDEHPGLERTVMLALAARVRELEQDAIH